MGGAMKKELEAKIKTEKEKENSPI